ncbi:Eco57I restriction-modification methylase domain-containing protein [Ralstonia solanacearum]|uniref:Eco57I restriction-modification methylase domain-containing protein n=1 Tax=Ralstonia solanacearum TaxID=305 RepID=UPI0023053D04|nr:Eco57I restriction-modification methylase domain-containing protein [Ralstonia solanacearum]MDB0567597.1 Eco57I restriction-modification methylase domain-containing protein [Ralstonia solanacearum]MDB0578847.1 Eco57I restriction-modification methylase domain-containing protein [Ralstonia solanacearum]
MNSFATNDTLGSEVSDAEEAKPIYPTHEERRLAVQATLDALKTSLERNQMGQFATPTALARDIVGYGLSLLPKDEPIRFLDPAIGTGSFYSALRATAGLRPVEAAVGYEIDPHYGEPAQALWDSHAVSIKLGDFTEMPPPTQDGYNLVICNPPYVRHHHMGAETKKRLLAASRAAAGVKLSGLAGLYVHFIALSHPWMRPGGIAGWLIPSEFMDVNYGRELKRYLLSEVTLLRIHRFDPDDAQFDDALVSSAVVWFRNERPPEGHQVMFTYGGTHASPALAREVAVLDLANESKWTRFPRQDVRPQTTAPILADVFDVKRGLATGDNSFFIMTRERIEELGLPLSQFRPILPSPRHIRDDEIAADENGDPLIDRPLYLLDCRLRPEDIQKQFPALWAYLQTGVDTVANAYLCRTRKAGWYRQEDRPPTPFLCSYMGRSDGKSGKPFRFLLNRSQATAANTYLMLYPKPHVATVLQQRPDTVRQIWECLNDIETGHMLDEGRVYGGGLHKMEPKELARVPAVRIYEILGLASPK